MVREVFHRHIQSLKCFCKKQFKLSGRKFHPLLGHSVSLVSGTRRNIQPCFPTVRSGLRTTGQIRTGSASAPRTLQTGNCQKRCGTSGQAPTTRQQQLSDHNALHRADKAKPNPGKNFRQGRPKQNFEQELRLVGTEGTVPFLSGNSTCVVNTGIGCRVQMIQIENNTTITTTVNCPSPNSSISNRNH